ATASLHGQADAPARSIPQAPSNTDRGIHLFRSPQRARPHTHGDGVESGEFTVRRNRSLVETPLPPTATDSLKVPGVPISSRRPSDGSLWSLSCRSAAVVVG